MTTTTATTNHWTRLTHVARDIKLSHSVFAMPFALLATFLAAAYADRLPRIVTVILIVLAMITARTVAMSVNRWADGKIDATNPRTKNRAVPSGRVSSRFMAMTALIAAALFILITAGFWLINHNPWPLILSPAVLAWLCGYSFTKRFTALCHLFLGVALGISPLAAAIAVEPSYLSTAEPYLLAGMVTAWVAGFDIIYALQDVATDRATGLFSLPSRLGESAALWISRALHLIALALLITLGQLSPTLGTYYAIAVVLVALLLIIEHALIWKSKTNHLNLAFLTVNGIISILLGLAGSIDAVRSVG